MKKSRFSLLITAGPTREHLDPVRFLSNPSTGRMGFELARAAIKEKHKVVLVSGPTHLSPPVGVKFVSVVSGLEMKEAVEKHFPGCDCLIMAAAVSDYCPRQASRKKVKKTRQSRTMVLKPVPDILLAAGRRKGNRIVVGFALETENLLKNALKKLKAKNLDIIVANLFSPKTYPFGDKPTSLIMLDKEGNRERFAGLTKRKIARILLKKTILLYNIKGEKKE
jgi:phosphopantothenoylcysteine decarboxylase/phosphopantothenate--cysteine ligase